LGQQRREPARSRVRTVGASVVWVKRHGGLRLVATLGALVAATAVLALPASAAAVWTAPKYISPAFIPADKPPDVEMDADGDSYFVYALGDGRVQARKYTAAGALAGTSTLTPRPTNPAVSPPGADLPTVAVNGAGDSAYAWLTENQAGTRFILLARTRSAGGVLGPLQTIAEVSKASSKIELPEISVDGDGDVVVAWTELETLSGRGEIKGRAFTSAGVLDATQTISSTQQVATAKLGKVEMQPDGDAVFAWEHSTPNLEGQVQTRILRPTGTLTPIREISGFDSTYPDFAMAPDGDMIFAWQHADAFAGGHNIQARRMSEAGTLGRTFNVSPRGGEASAAEVALNTGGAAAVAYSAKDPISGKTTIKGRTLSASDQLGQTHSLSGNSVEDPTDPQVGISTAGRIVFGWLHHTATADRLQSKTLTPAGALGTLKTVASAPNLLGPRLAVAASGQAAAVWQDVDVKRIGAAFGP
jgi:hypothetical protein